MRQKVKHKKLKLKKLKYKKLKHKKTKKTKKPPQFSKIAHKCEISHAVKKNDRILSFYDNV